jgi:hypothetical protein
MGNFNDIPNSFLAKRGTAGLGTFGDMHNFIDRTSPATSAPKPPGPANFAVQVAPPANIPLPTDTNGLLARLIQEQRGVRDIMARILEELIRQNIASRPSIRAVAVDSTGETLNWQAIGVMDRLTLKNNGPAEIWLSFDMNGPAVNAFTSNLSFSLKADSTLNLTHSLFTKVGVKCASGQTAVVDAIAWQSVAGNQAAAIA